MESDSAGIPETVGFQRTLAVPAAAADARHSRAPPFVEPSRYARHRPGSRLLCQLVELHYPTFSEMRAMAGGSLPDCIEEEFDAYLKCGRWEDDFPRVRCQHCHAEKLVALNCRKRGFCPSCGARLADEVLPVRQSLPQRVGSQRPQGAGARVWRGANLGTR
jgi:hypothetical protein